MSTAPRIPRRRTTIIPVGNRPNWYEFSTLRVAVVAAVALAGYAVFALVITILSRAS